MIGQVLGAAAALAAIGGVAVAACIWLEERRSKTQADAMARLTGSFARRS